MERYKSGSKTCSSEDIEIILKGSIGFLPNGHILLENNDIIKSYGMVCVSCDIKWAQWDSVYYSIMLVYSF